MNPSAPRGKDTKYARRERERRFLLAGAAPGPVVRVVEIVDRYIKGTRLRLRSSVEGGSAEAVYKLTQKVPASDGGPGLITTIYLTAEEHGVFAQLPAAVLHKTRSSVPPLGVDVFRGSLGGLILAEAEFENDEAMAAFEVPPFVVAEVTDDPRFTGGCLVAAARGEVRNALQDFEIAIKQAR